MVVLDVRNFVAGRKACVESSSQVNSIVTTELLSSPYSGLSYYVWSRPPGVGSMHVIELAEYTADRAYRPGPVRDRREPWKRRPNNRSPVSLCSGESRANGLQVKSAALRNSSS